MNPEKLCQRLGYGFKDANLLKQALTHKSFAHERHLSLNQDNERLEFLGDAVLDLVLSDDLMSRFPEMNEGGLSKLRASLVSEHGLYTIAQNIELGKYLLIGRGEKVTGGREKSSILADALEALFAAIYLDSRDDGGLEQVARVIMNLFEQHIPRQSQDFISQDAKTTLQEVVQKQKQGLVTYELVGEFGPDHQKEFEMIALIDGVEYGRSLGNSKKQAEQRAARIALESLQAQFEQAETNEA